MDNILITMSGGTTSVINATLAGIIDAARESPSINKIYAGHPGILGTLSQNLLDLTNAPTHTLKRSPGSALIGTTRVGILNNNDLDVLSGVFKKYGIKYFVNIGGNGTIKQSKLISSSIDSVNIAAVPKTVDNDLGDAAFEDLWFTVGFPSCVNFWYHKTKMLNNENLGAYTHDKVIIAQTFGRKTGFLAGSLRTFDPDRKLPLILLLPEDQQPPEKVIGKIENTLIQHDRAIVGICEGYGVSDCNFVYDKTGQAMYGSSGSSAMQQLINLCVKSGIQARGYNPTIDQRQNFEHTVDFDINLSYSIGREVVTNFNLGINNFFQSYSRKGLISIDLKDIDGFSREMKKEWIDTGNFDVSDNYIKYLRDIK